MRIRESDKKWHTWRAVAGFTYVLICLFDFILMPMYTVYQNDVYTQKLIESVSDDSQFIYLLTHPIKHMPWTPITFGGMGLFHITFGAILTGAVVSDKILENNISKRRQPEIKADNVSTTPSKQDDTLTYTSIKKDSDEILIDRRHE